MLTDKQRAHARRHATQDAEKHAYTAEVLQKNGKPTTWTPERVQELTEYQATISGAPKREPARTQWKEEYTYHFTAYMLNSGAMEPEPPTPKVQVTKDGPAYLLPGIEPVGEQKGDNEQLALM